MTTWKSPRYCSCRDIRISPAYNAICASVVRTRVYMLGNIDARTHQQDVTFASRFFSDPTKGQVTDWFHSFNDGAHSSDAVFVRWPIQRGDCPGFFFFLATAVGTAGTCMVFYGFLSPFRCNHLIPIEAEPMQTVKNCQTAKLCT